MARRKKSSTADDLRYVLTGQSEDEWDKLTAQEKLSVWQSSRQRPGNASYFAFTATPKHSTLMLFGQDLTLIATIGIVLGTISSIFVACPLLTIGFLTVTKQDLMPKAKDEALLARRP